MLEIRVTANHILKYRFNQLDDETEEDFIRRVSSELSRENVGGILPNLVIWVNDDNGASITTLGTVVLRRQIGIGGIKRELCDLVFPVNCY